MGKEKICYSVSIFSVVISLLIKLALIFKYNDQLTLLSDDLNYIKSAILLAEKGRLTYQNYWEPTVFITPVYPIFLAAIIKVFGYGSVGLHMVRIIQAVFSSFTSALIFLIAKEQFNLKIAMVSCILVSFYFPNIVTSGIFLTETLFTMLLCLMIYFSLKISSVHNNKNFWYMGILWAFTTLCRPVIALYPVLFFLYLLMSKKISIKACLKYSLIMGLAFVIVMSPWWVRNYSLYKEFIPLAASSGNPMLQGTYVDYKQTPEKIVYYKLGKNFFETNKIETEVARKRLISEFKNDFFGYLRWYTVGKTYFFWGMPFYWKQFFSVDYKLVIMQHYFLLSGFLGIAISLFKSTFKHDLLVYILIYYNILHCIYMAFDRYAFPVMPILSIFCAYFLYIVYNKFRSLSKMEFTLL